MKNEFICDDRLDELKLNEDIRNMTDEEFEVFLEYVKKNDKYPDKYYMSWYHLVKKLGGIFMPKNKKGQVCTRKNYRNRSQDAGKCRVNVE